MPDQSVPPDQRERGGCAPVTPAPAIRTVKRNSREAREMWDRATRALSYTLSNSFIGQDVAVEGARSYYERTAANLKPSIRHNGRAYVVRYHGNHWIELLVPPTR